MSHILAEFDTFVKAEYRELILKGAKKHWWQKPKRFKLIIKPIIAGDLIDRESLKKRVEEIKAEGIEEIPKIMEIMANEQKEKLNKMSIHETCQLLFSKGVVYPKIVDKEEELQPDELPISKIPPHIRDAILTEIIKISPIFATKV